MSTGCQLEESIDQLSEMIDGARRMTEAGQLVELDVLAMKIAVLTDALNAGAPSGERPSPLVKRLEALVKSLNQLDLALDLQQADKRLRAQLAYGGERPKS